MKNKQVKILKFPPIWPLYIKNGNSYIVSLSISLEKSIKITDQNEMNSQCCTYKKQETIILAFCLKTGVWLQFPQIIHNLYSRPKIIVLESYCLATIVNRQKTMTMFTWVSESFINVHQQQHILLLKSNCFTPKWNIYLSVVGTLRWILDCLTTSH